MPEPQKPALLPRRTTARLCLVCQWPMEVQRIAEARVGFEHWTLRCPRCGRIDQVQVPTDPLKSDAPGWTKGELRRPH
jgi:hypothetical protein